MRVDRLWPILKLRFRSIFRRDRVERDLDDELAFHLDRLTEAYRTRGLTPAAARIAAVRDMDGLERLRDECRDARGVQIVDDMRQDVRYALRMLARSPTFTAIAVGTLALGIGATVGVFTVVDAVLLRALPIDDADRLAIVNAEDLRQHGTVGASWTKYQLLRAQTTPFSGVAAYVPREFAVDAGDAPAQVLAARATASFFPVLGVVPSLGRNFRAEEDVEGAAPVALVTDAFWRRRLGADPGIVGRTIRVDARATTIVGVLPPGFRFQFSDREPQIYLPCVFTPDVMTAAQIRNGAGFLGYVARLKPGVTFEQAARDLDAFDRRYQHEHGSFTDAGKYGLHLVPFVDDLVGNLRPALALLMGAVLLVLLIACANVAHLLLARATARRREIAVRLALGASPARLGRQFVTESVVIALAGCAAGLVVAHVAVGALVAYGPANIPRLAGVAPDGRAIAFALVASFATAILFGTMPAIRVRGASMGDGLTDGRAGGLTRGGGRWHRWIAASETAVTVVLLIGAGLLFESLVRLQAVDVGFEPRHVYAARITLPRAAYPAPYQRETFFTRLIGGIRAQPGIDAVGATSYLPMGGSNYGFFFVVEGQPRLGPGRDPVTAVRHVSVDYFRVMSIPLIRGRAFTGADGPSSRPVAIVNETAARRYFAGVDPIGRHVANSGDGVMREIVGIVGDVRFDGPSRERQEELYLPYRQVPWPSMSVVVASTLPADAVAGALRRVVGRIDRDQAVAEIRPMTSVVAATTTQQQFTSALLASFAALATVLAAVGLYGVIALFVGQKRHEFGIRMALGAQRADVLWLVMREGGRVVAAGVVAGLAGAAALSGALRGLLFGVSATEPLMYGVGAGLLGIVGCVACYLPARRAISVPPIDALRIE